MPVFRPVSRLVSRYVVPTLAFALTLISVAAQPAWSETATPSRVLSRVDDTQLVKLPGNTYLMARPEFDKGLVDSNKLLERIVLVLERSPEQEAALAAFNQRQLDPKSADFHHWLHADEFGKLYGPSDSDIAAVTSWLQNHGFAIGLVSKGRVTIEFTGTVAQVQEAFHVEMHRYLVHGEEHIANDRNPQIPAALAPVVNGVASLHDFFPKPQSIFGKYVKRDRRTGKITVLEPKAITARPKADVFTDASGKTLPPGTGKAVPQLTYVDGSGDTHEDISPYDFATIYNILPSWKAGINGKGVTIAISGISDVDASDFNDFRSTFSLPASTLTTIHNGKDPGADGGGGQGENTLDVEMSGAAAPGAQIDLVVSADTSTTSGVQLSDAYIVDNETAPIMSASYGECEIGLGTSGNAAYNKIWQQGASEGISEFESSGDQGSAGCSDSDAQGPNPDHYGLQVNGMASSPYITSVGGTDFTWSLIDKPVSTYWNASNNADGATAKGILPEVPWNGTCTNPLLLNLFTGEANSEQLCNDAYNSSDFQGLVKITGGSGGVSACTTSSNSEFSTCSGGYAKPSWQAGPGVPADGKRDVPDVSLFASDGFPDGINGSAILFCEASSSPEKTCDYTNPDYVIYQEIGGTSASSPFTAGIMALVLQKTGEVQGLANPVFYQLAQAQATKGTACNSSTVANGNACVFYDISSGTNSQVCATGGRDCVTNTSGDTLGLLSGYAATTGYDRAIGLGSMNVTNLVNTWPTTSSTPTVTLTPASMTFASTKVGSTAATQTATLKNTGTTSATIANIELTGTNYTSYGATTTCGSTLAASASCTATVSFKPTTTGTLTASLEFLIDGISTAKTVALTGTGAAATAPAVTLTPTSEAFTSQTVGTTSASKTVTLKNSGTATLDISSIAAGGTNASSFTIPSKTCGTTLAAGSSCTFTVAFKPTAAGSLTGDIAITDNATGSPQKVTLTGTGTAASAPAVTLTPTSEAFTSEAVGSTSASKTVTLKNSGTATLDITSIVSGGTDASSFTIPSKTCGTTLAAGSSCTFTVAFKPAAAGSLSGYISITDQATGSPQKVTLTGTGTAATAPAVTLSPTSEAFGSELVGSTTASKTVTLKNSGTAVLDITSIALGGTNPTSFTLPSKTCGTTLAAGSSCTFTVAFKPTVTGARSAYVAITDKATGSPQKVTLTGTGTAPAVTLSPTSEAFGSELVGSTTASKTVTLKNSGTATLDITSIVAGGTDASSFTIPSKTCGTTLAAAASCTFTVAFKPAASGALSGYISITDKATGSPQKVTLTGTGTAPAVTLSPTSEAFTTTKVGVTSASKTVTLKNSGTATLDITSIALGGTNPTSFTLPSKTCGTTLAAGSSCTFTVAFKPTVTGARSAYVAITDKATGSPQKVTLTGTGD